MPPKTSCPVSLTLFQDKAEPLKVTINGQEMLAEVKAFGTETPTSAARAAEGAGYPSPSVG